MGSAQLQTHPEDTGVMAATIGSAFPDTDGAEAIRSFALKQQAAERVAAHRARRTATVAATSHTRTSGTGTANPRTGRSSHIAAAVAERYAQSQSYRSFLAAEAERAVHQADAAAQIASLNAEAIAAAQQKLLATFENWEPGSTGAEFPASGTWDESIHAEGFFEDRRPEPVTESSTAGFTVRLYEDVGRSRLEDLRDARLHRSETLFDEAEGLALDDEIAFRKDPVFAETVAPELTPANLIEFPRQLVAARKARPRIAEGPLRDEAAAKEDSGQLRIFEVETEQPANFPATDAAAPEWFSILLAARPAEQTAASDELAFDTTLLPHTASPGRRLMAGAVDMFLVLVSFGVFASVAITVVEHLPGNAGTIELSHATAAIASAGCIALFALLYQIVFFTFADATPGMRYARIGLCTFSDENPSRAAMRLRILAALLSGCTLGIGYLWAWLDEDHLGWHDRISRMYQRSY